MKIWFRSSVWNAIAKTFLAPDAVSGQPVGKAEDKRFDYVMDNNESTFEIKHAEDASFMDQKLLQELQQVEQSVDFLEEAKNLNQLLHVKDDANIGDIGNERLIFGLEHMQELLKAAEGQFLIVYDASLLEAVRQKVEHFKYLKAKITDVCTSQH